ncbi:MAG: response regulator transcription factor [Chloroflexi bacterium]|nr:response regulator transcription factor [Chloroflexota bacterium]
MRINVAIVEDDRELRESWTRVLNAHPRLRCVAACASADEALRQLPECCPDVVLMYINLPGMSGIRCAALLKQRLPRTQILMVTVYSNTHYIFEALKAGASGYLLKSHSSEEVIRSIIEVMEGGAPMTGQIARRVIEAFRRPAPHGMREAQLTDREKEILQLLAQGFSNKEIAAQIEVAVSTVRTHIEHIYEKLHVHCRTEAAAKYLGDAATAQA